MHEGDACKVRVLSYTLRFDTTLRTKGKCKSWIAQVDESLRTIRDYQQNVLQHCYLLDTLVIKLSIERNSYNTSCNTI